MKTINELITTSTKDLPKSEIEYLLISLLKKERHELYLQESKVTDKIARKFHHLVQQRKKGVPVQYLLNSAPFLAYELYVDERVFIPRPETEELVVKTISRLHSPNLILELGTGSAAIAIALANAFPEAKIIATDISSEAIKVAKINIAKYNLIDRISLIQANLFNLPDAQSYCQRFDCLISNPPYVDQDIIPALSPTVKDFEPIKSLNGGQDGFEIIRPILKQGMNFLKPEGILALEIDPAQKDLISAEVPKAEFEIDLSGRIRFCFINKKS